MATAETTYNRFDAATKGLEGYAILRDGKNVGRIVIRHATACSAFLQVWNFDMQTGRAGGGGYDRASAAIGAAADKLSVDALNQNVEAADNLIRIRNALTGGRDGDGWQRKLEAAGFTLANVLG